MEDRGSVSILCAGLAVLLLAVGIGVVRVSEALVTRQTAQSAADAVALAAAHGLDRAEPMAAANGASVVGITTGAGWVEVEVEKAGARARARSTRAVAVGGAGAGGGTVGGLDPRVVAGLARAEALIGRRIPIVSGYRSPEQQAALWERRHSNPFPVAPPGSSAHERGLAVDVSIADAALVESLHVGLCRPYPNDPVHLELC